MTKVSFGNEKNHKKIPAEKMCLFMLRSGQDFVLNVFTGKMMYQITNFYGITIWVDLP